MSTPEITVFTKSGGPLTKSIKLLRDGVTFRSKGADCRMWEGRAQRQPVSDVNALAETISKLNPHQAIALGRLRDGLPSEIAITTKSKLGNGEAISRSLENFAFSPGVPAYALLDHDSKWMPEHVRRAIIAAGGVWKACCAILPALEHTAHLIRKSTSSGLRRSDTGQELPGSDGLHVYILVMDGADIGRFLGALHDRAWLSGFGWHGIGAGGKLLERSIIDKLVGSPERLCFEGAPVLKPPLAQDAEARRPIAIDGAALDTAAECPPLNDAEISRLRELRAESLRRLTPEADRVRKEFVERKATNIATRTGKPITEARRIAGEWAGGVLSPEVELPFDRQEFAGCTVGDVLANPKRFDGATMADPVEGVCYGSSKAMLICRDDGAVWINSFAHGSARYTLEGARVSAADEFDFVELLESPPTQPGEAPKEKIIRPTLFTWQDPATIPPRQWLYDRHYIRQFVSATIAPGGVGKSSMAIVEALAMVTGKPLLGVMPRQVCRVWYWCGEDPLDEIKRRVAAACLRHDIAPEDIGERLFLDSGRTSEIIMATAGRDGVTIAKPMADSILRAITDFRIDAMIVDPFVSSHRIGENDNAGMDMVVKEWARIADRTSAAIELVHHSRKTGGSEVTIEDARGAGSFGNAVRSGRVINTMTNDEARKARVDNHRLFFRVDSGKANLAPPSDHAVWRHLVSVPLGNGDDVGVVRSWKWPDAMEGVTTDDFERVAAVIRGGQWRKNYQAANWVGYAVADALDLDTEDKHDRAKINGMLKSWLSTGELTTAEGKDANRQPRLFVVVAEDN